MTIAISRAQRTPSTLVSLVVAFMAVAVAVVGLQTIDAGKAHGATATSQLGTVAAASPSMSRSDYESRVLKWINVRRHEHGLRSLRWSTCTDNVANRWGKYLASTGQFYHQSMYKIMVKCNAYYAGETLAMGGVSPKRIVYLWMHSSEHRAILLSKQPRRIGIGGFPNVLGEWVVCADFMRY